MVSKMDVPRTKGNSKPSKRAIELHHPLPSKTGPECWTFWMRVATGRVTQRPSSPKVLFRAWADEVGSGAIVRRSNQLKNSESSRENSSGLGQPGCTHSLRLAYCESANRNSVGLTFAHPLTDLRKDDLLLPAYLSGLHHRLAQAVIQKNLQKKNELRGLVKK
jgi:hypothetical protein